MRLDVAHYAASALGLLGLPSSFLNATHGPLTHPAPPHVHINASAAAVDAYVAAQAPVVRCGVLDNIGPRGTKAQAARAGAVIASPSSAHPDYLYTWTRDAALVLKALSDELMLPTPAPPPRPVGHGTPPADLQMLLDEYAALQRTLQGAPNPSGAAHGAGLGEPKFHTDGSAFRGPWGRPQRDGPALRAMVLIRYANWLLDGGGAAARGKAGALWDVVHVDLAYVARTWDQRSFDLWEEVASPSFFTTAVQHRALREGAAIARRMGKSAALAEEYATQADNTLCFLQTYWNASAGHITANPHAARSGVDANTVLATIHTWDVAAGCDAATFQPCSDRALANLKAFVDAFRALYPINRNAGAAGAVATGRYPEDVYDGTTYDGSTCEHCLGNPWYLANFAVAEQLYDALLTWDAAGALNITATSLPFFAQLAPEAAPGTYPAASAAYARLTAAVRAHADAFLAVNAAYTPANGGLAEQFSRHDGRPASAFDLTWSYAAAGTAFAARAGRVPRAWGAARVRVPGECAGGAGAVKVRFEVEAYTEIGEHVYVVGSAQELGAWDAGGAVRLSAERYPTWSVTVDLPANQAAQYKYVRMRDGVEGMSVAWEADPARDMVARLEGENVREDVWQ